MNVNLTAVILDIDGKPLRESDGVEAMLESGERILLASGTKVKKSDGELVELVDESKEMTLGFLFKSAMLNNIAADKDETEDQKYDRWQKAKYFVDNMNNESVKVEMKEVTAICARIKVLYPSPVIYGNVRDLTEPDEGESSDNESED